MPLPDERRLQSRGWAYSRRVLSKTGVAGRVTPCAPLRFRLLLLLCFTACALSAQIYVPPASHRADTIIDSNWRFIRQDVSGAQASNFDDSAWSIISLPHTWNNLDGQDGGNNYYRGIGWYRTHCTVDASLAGRTFFLEFNGAFLVTDVYVNGNFLGEHQGGFA